MVCYLGGLWTINDSATRSLSDCMYSCSFANYDPSLSTIATIPKRRNCDSRSVDRYADCCDCGDYSNYSDDYGSIHYYYCGSCFGETICVVDDDDDVTKSCDGANRCCGSSRTTIDDDVNLN